jgi:hypothetical protein
MHVRVDHFKRVLSNQFVDKCDALLVRSDLGF